MIDLSAQCLALLGLREAAPLTTSECLRRVHPDDRERLASSLAAALESRQPSLSVELRLQRDDGSEAAAYAVACFEYADDGTLSGAQGIVQDLTRRRAAESALRRERELSQAIVDTIPVMLAVHQPGSRVQLNREFQRVLGWTNGDANGGDLTALVYPDAGHRREAAAFRQAATPGWRDFVATARDGSRIPSRWAHVRLEDGTSVAIGLDLRDQHGVARALRRSEARWRQMAEAMPQLVWTCSPDGRHDYLSPQWVEYTGRPTRELLGYGWLERLHPEDRDRVADAWQRAGASSFFDAEYRLRRHDGAWRWFKARAVPARDPDGRVTRWFGSSTDIHDLRSAEEAVREADRRKTEFLATLSHELRNPLAPIRYALELLDRGDEDGRLAAPRHVITRQLGQLVRLVDDLLDATRIASNKVRLQVTRLDLASVVQSGIEAALPNIERSHHDLQIALPAEREWVDGDPDRLAQVVTNLLNNAARYTPPGGRIQVSAAPDDGHVVLSVADTGVGLQPGDLQRVFDIFAQAGEQGRGGLGIGLAIVKGIVELHGGAVEARSAGPGRGAEFRVTLPRADPPPGELEPAPARASPGASRRILVVDDNTDAAEMMRALLELAGHEVRVANDAASALAETAAFRPDMGLLDIGLPDMNGYELARLVRQEPSWRGMYLVAITGWGQAEDRQRALASGFDAHLTKPADPDEVEKLVARARRRSEQ